MGNEDLIIVINNEVVIIILGKDYDNRNDAIKMAIDKWVKQQEHTKKICDFPEEINNEVQSVKVYSTELSNV